MAAAMKSGALEISKERLVVWWRLERQITILVVHWRQGCAAFAEDAAQDLGDGEDKLAVGDFAADGGGDPLAGGADAAPVAGGAEVAAFTGEG